MTAAVLPERPGFGWLVRHELRLVLRDRSATSVVRRVLALLVLMLAPVAIGVFFAWNLRRSPAVPVAGFGLVLAANVGLVLVMLSGACVYVLRAFHDRGDLDLLLSAPIPPARVLAAKSVAIHAAVALPLLVLSAPFLIVSAFLGHPGWLGASVEIIVTAMVATSLAFVITAALFRAVGSRRARIIIQVSGGLFAATVAILGQAPSFAPGSLDGLQARFSGRPMAPFDWPARAIFGAPLPLVGMVAFGIVCAVAASRMAARNLAEATPVADADAAIVAKAGRYRFRAGLLPIILLKELRLLWRDPELLSQLALQLAYMIPAVALIFSGGGGVSPARLAATSVIFAGLLSSALAWLIICGEDAPELIDSAPVTKAIVARAKLLAACVVPIAILVTPLAIIASSSIRGSLIALVFCLAAAVSAALQQAWASQPQRRITFRFRRKGSLLLAAGEYVMAASWSAAAAAFIQHLQWAVLPALLSVVIMLVSRSARSTGRETRFA